MVYLITRILHSSYNINLNIAQSLNMSNCNQINMKEIILSSVVFLLGLTFTSCVGQENHLSVPLETDDGVVLDGRYYSPNTAGPGVLLLCQCDPSTDQNEYNSLAGKLQKEGYHVLSFDYRGFAKSGGTKPNLMAMESMNEVMQYWREHWLGDVELAFGTLQSFKGVEADKMTIVGASCGNFLALEFALKYNNLPTLTLLGGPVDDQVISKLEGNTELPMLIIAGNEGPTFEWVDRIFAATQNEKSRIMKFKTVSHGTGIFHVQPQTEEIIVDWINDTIGK